MVINTRRKQKVKRPCPLSVKIALACKADGFLRSRIEHASSPRAAIRIFKQWQRPKSTGRKSDESRPHHPKRRSESTITGALIPLSYTETPNREGSGIRPARIPRILPAHQPDEKNPAVTDDNQRATLVKGVSASPVAITHVS
jgi:hypothetical protein